MDLEADPEARKHGKKRQAELAAPKGYVPPTNIIDPMAEGTPSVAPTMLPQDRAILAADAQARAVAALRDLELARSGVPSLQQTLARPLSPPVAPVVGLPGKPGEMLAKMATGAKPKKMNAGGEVSPLDAAGKAMDEAVDSASLPKTPKPEKKKDPPPYKVHKELDTHFEVSGSDGKPFKVAKKGLRPQLVKEIQSFAAGGMVEESGYVAPDYLDPNMGQPGPLSPFQPAAPPSVYDQEMAGFAPAPVKGPTGLPFADTWARMNNPNGMTAPLPPSPGIAPQPQNAGSIAPPTDTPPIPAPGEAPSATKAPPAGASQAAAPQQQGPSDIDRALLAEQQAIDQQANLAAQRAQSEAAARAQAQMDEEQRRRDAEEELAAHNAKRDALQNDILNGRLDRGRLWANSDLGQKFASGIALLLGGLGASATGGRNLVAEQLERTIDQDIDIQKAELGKKQNLLSIYMQEGKDIASAQRLAKADKMDALAAEIQRIGASFGGQEAAARAMQAKADLMLKAEKMRMDVIKFESDRRLANAHIELLRAQAGAAGQAGKMAMEKLAVTLPNGQRAYAQSEGEHAKVNDALVAYQDMKTSLGKYAGLIGKLPGLPTAMGGSGSEAETELQNLRTGVGKLKALGALAKEDLKIVDGMIGDISSWRTTSNTDRKKLEAFGSTLDSMILANLKTRLRGG